MVIEVPTLSFLPKFKTSKASRLATLKLYVAGVGVLSRLHVNKNFIFLEELDTRERERERESERESVRRKQNKNTVLSFCRLYKWPNQENPLDSKSEHSNVARERLPAADPIYRIVSWVYWGPGPKPASTPSETPYGARAERFFPPRKLKRGRNWP